MTGFLLDTNVISELRRPRPNADVVAFVAARAEDDLFISEVTFAEIRFGIEQVADAGQRVAIRVWLDNVLRPLFEGRTLAITENVLLRWRLLLEAGRRRGHTFGQLDLFVAATAAENDLIVVSRDTTHFIAAGVAVLDPWTAMFTSPTGDRQTIADLTDVGLLNRLSAQVRPGRR